MTLNEIIAELKEANPTLQTGSNESGYVQLTEAEYEATIQEWAQNRLLKLEKIAAENAKLEAGASAVAKLEAIGLTSEEIAALRS